MKAKKRPGPKLTDPPHLIRIKSALEQEGYPSIKEAAEAVRKHRAKEGKQTPSYDMFVTTFRDGLPADPRESLLEALDWLKVLELVPRKESA